VPEFEKIRSFAALLQSGSAPDRFLATILDAISDILLIHDRDGKLIYANTAGKQYFQRFGTSPEVSDVRARATGHFFEVPSGRPLAFEELPLPRALIGEPNPHSEFLVTNVSGQPPFWLDATAQGLRNSAGEIVGAIVSIRNITTFKEKEAKAATQRQLLDYVYDRSLAGIVHSALDGTIIDCNEAFARMLGYSSKEEICSVNIGELYFFADARTGLLRLLEGAGHLSEYEVCCRRKDGTPCWVLVNISLFRPSPESDANNIIATVVDITERKLWEESLQQSERRFSAFMRHLPGVAFTKDLDGRYVYYNDACLPLFGKKPEEIVGRTDLEIWPPEEALVFRRNDAEVIAKNRPIEVVEPVPHADGQHTWLMYKFPIVENGAVAFLGGIGIDITEHRQLEEKLAQSSRMEALGRLAGGVAHDFNNLLTMISGYSQLLLEGLAEPPRSGVADVPGPGLDEANSTEPRRADARLRIYVTEVLASAQRAASLTGQLLAFSRRQTAQPAVFDFRGLVHGLQQLLQRTLGEDVELLVRCGPEPCTVRADFQQMEQVLMNLAANARDAMPLGGTLEIECRRIHPPIPRPPVNGNARPSFCVLLEVRDTGVGMDQETRSHIFEPFFSSKGVGKGTGLGLSTVYGVVSQADGDVDVATAPGGGTTFRIRLPLAEGYPQFTTAAAPLRTGAETVLLVEDEPGLRMLVETVLRQAGYGVMAAESGAQAIELISHRDRPVDIVLTDVIMPRMSGAQLVAQLRRGDPGLKVLFMSGYTDDMLAGCGLPEGNTQLIQKPFSADALIRALRAVLDAPASSHQSATP